MTTANRFNRVTKPMTDLVVLNAEATGTVLQRQNAFVAEVIAASVDQVRVLTEAGSLRDAVDAQRAYIREIGEKFSTTTRDNLETIRHAGRDAGQVVRGVFRRVEADVNETIDEVRSDVNETIDDVRTEAADVVENVADSIAPTKAAPTLPQGTKSTPQY